jgi:transcriptional regulator with XRE-family HTH domain
MSARRNTREYLGLTYKHMSKITGLPPTAVAKLEQQKNTKNVAADEVYLLYFNYVALHGEPILPDSNELDALIFSRKTENLEVKLRKIRRNIVLYTKRLDGAKTNYSSSLASLSGLETIKRIANDGSDYLKARIEITRLEQLKLITKKQFDTVIRYKTRLEWAITEERLLAEMLNKGSIL